ncbi:MAG: hypothetical protein ACK6CU_07560 [Deltaproteobacteria bacterium]
MTRTRALERGHRPVPGDDAFADVSRLRHAPHEHVVALEHSAFTDGGDSHPRDVEDGQALDPCS